MLKKSFFAVMAFTLASGFTLLASVPSASAAGPITLAGPWRCPTGALTVTFNPPLVAFAMGNSTFTLTGGMTNCTEPAMGKNQSPSATIGGFLGVIPTDCTLIANMPPAPAMAGGFFNWSAKGKKTFVPSTNINFGLGSPITVNAKGKLSFDWPQTVGTIGAGSEAGRVYLKAGTTATNAQLTNACLNGGIGAITLTGKDA